MTAPDDLRERLGAAIDWYAAKSPMTSPQIATLREVLAHPERLMGEPVAWMSPGRERLEWSRKDTVYGSHTIPLYAPLRPRRRGRSDG